MNAYQEIELSHSVNAYAYFRAYLQDGTSLAQHLAASIDLNNGRIAAFLPANTDESRIAQFEFGGIASGGITQSQLVDTLQTSLKHGCGAVCVIESAITNKGDPWLQYYPELPVFYFGIEVYYLLSNMDRNKPMKIDQVIRVAESHRFMAVMTTIPPAHSFPVGQEFSLDDLMVFTENAKKIAIGAYDGEGYLIWSRVG